MHELLMSYITPHPLFATREVVASVLGGRLRPPPDPPSIYLRLKAQIATRLRFATYSAFISKRLHVYSSGLLTITQ